MEKKLTKMWTLETPRIPNTKSVSVRDFEREPTEEDVQKFIEDVNTTCGTIFVNVWWKIR